MIYVYCPRPSNGALELVQALEARRIRRFDGMDFWVKNKRLMFEDGDIVVCWGAEAPDMEGLRVLNSSEKLTKEEELKAMMNAGIYVPDVYSPRNVESLRRNSPNWKFLGRSNYHLGGNDLLNPGKFRTDFYTTKQDFKEEYRLHIFGGASIRAGVKKVRDGFTLVEKDSDFKLGQNLAHPWIRSFDAGWRIDYDGFTSTPRLRKVAKGAIRALGLVFGAVDVGRLAGTPEETYMILEVNRAPGIEGNSVKSYARAIKKWIDKGVEALDPEDQPEKVEINLPPRVQQPQVVLPPIINQNADFQWRAFDNIPAGGWGQIDEQAPVPNPEFIRRIDPPLLNRVRAEQERVQIELNRHRQRQEVLRDAARMARFQLDPNGWLDPEDQG